jgi:polyisoprenyl-teichoic acid--peptidoglycan teichoic acid transferase
MTDRAEPRRSRSFQARPTAATRARGGADPNIRAVPRARSDARRVASAALSAIIPGLGQALNRRPRLALVLVLPVVVGVIVALVAVNATSPAMLVSRVVEPHVLATLLTLNLALLGLRFAAVAQAFLDPRHEGKPGVLAMLALVGLILFTAAPHVIARSWGQSAQSAFARIFTSSAPATTQPAALTSRINVLIVGIDKTAMRTETLTDSMMVASLDPVGHTISLVSLPRDMVNVPLGNGSDFGPKLNSLMSYAERHPSDFPDGGLKALESAVGALLGIHIDYYARMDFVGFIKLIDSVHGVDIIVKEGFNDPLYDGFALGSHGYSITPGFHHFDGPHALAYARSRQALGQSDFKRAARQQEVLVALRSKILSGGAVFWRVPELLSALGDFVSTDVPVDLLPPMAAVVDAMGRNGVTRMVISYPLVRPGRSQYGSIQIPDIRKIRAVARGLFTTPGVKPTPWPSPTLAPTKKTPASASPTASG